MKLLEINNIVKKDIPLHYRKEFTAEAIFSIAEDRLLTKNIKFIIEYNHSGDFDVKVNLLEPLNYPLLPTLRMIKELIIDLEKRGAL